MGGHGEHSGGGITPGMIGRTIGWVLGGLCAGTGILTLISTRSFGVVANGAITGKDVAQSISTLGYDGINNLGAGSTGPVGVGLILLGIAILATVNNGAWKETGGY